MHIEQALFDRNRETAILEEVETELVESFLDGTLTTPERSSFADLLASCSRLQKLLVTTIRCRILNARSIPALAEPPIRTLQLQVSGEVVNLCCAYRDRELTAAEEQAFERLCEHSRPIRRLFELAVDLKRSTYLPVLEIEQPVSTLHLRDS